MLSRNGVSGKNVSAPTTLRCRGGDRSEIGCTPSQHIRHDALRAVLRVVDLHCWSQTLIGADRLGAAEVLEQVAGLPRGLELVFLTGSKRDHSCSVAAPIPFRNDFRLGHLPSSLCRFFWISLAPFLKAPFLSPGLVTQPLASALARLLGFLKHWKLGPSKPSSYRRSYITP